VDLRLTSSTYGQDLDDVAVQAIDESVLCPPEPNRSAALQLSDQRLPPLGFSFEPS